MRAFSSAEVGAMTGDLPPVPDVVGKPSGPGAGLTQGLPLDEPQNGALNNAVSFDGAAVAKGVDIKAAPGIRQMGQAGEIPTADMTQIPTAVSQKTEVASLGASATAHPQSDFGQPVAGRGEVAVEANVEPHSAMRRQELASVSEPEYRSVTVATPETPAASKPAAHPGVATHHAASPAHAPAPAHAPTTPTPAPSKQVENKVDPGGPTKTVDRTITKGGPERDPEKATTPATGADGKTKDAIKEAKHDGSIFGPMKQFVLEHPALVAGALAMAAASMGGGWKWSLVAGAAGYLGTSAFSSFDAKSKKAEGFDKIAEIHGQGGPKKA